MTDGPAPPNPPRAHAPRASGIPLGPLALLALLLGAVAAAGGIPVAQNASIDTVSAQRFHLAAKFEVAETRLDLWLADPGPGTDLAAPPDVGGALPGPLREPPFPAVSRAGTRDSPAELTEVMTPVVPPIRAGNWTYTVALRERSPEAVGPGERFAVDLLHDGDVVGTAYVAQDAATPAKEGARVTFDLGRDAPENPLLVVYVRPLPRTEASVALELDVDPAFEVGQATLIAAAPVAPPERVCSPAQVAIPAQGIPIVSSLFSSGLVPAQYATPGNESLPAEITEGMTPASTPLCAGSAALVLAFWERAPAAVRPWVNYSVEVSIDRRALGALFVTQRFDAYGDVFAAARQTAAGACVPAACPLKDLAGIELPPTLANASLPLREGARLTFDLGAGPAPGSVVNVTLREVLKPDYVLDSVDGAEWRGADGPIRGVVNPALDATSGKLLSIKIHFTEDAGAHNLAILKDGRKLAKSADIHPAVRDALLRWTPPAPGTYVYRCDYHPPMTGVIQVNEPR